MKLIAVDEAKLESVLNVLEPMISQHRRSGDVELVQELLLLKNYLRARIETAPEVPTASSMGKKGGGKANIDVFRETLDDPKSLRKRCSAFQLEIEILFL